MKKTKVAIIGAGNIAKTMAVTLDKMKHVQCYAVASRDLTKALDFAETYGFKKAYGSYEELVNDKKVDLIYIATPHSHHFEHMKLCISHGKPVLCEKAFTANAAQAEEIIALAKEKNVLVAEAIWVRYMPMVATIKEMIESEIIGKPVYLTANLGYTISHIDRMVNPELAGGSLLDLGVYPLNFAAMIFGDKIKKISSSCTYTETGLDESAAIMIAFEDKKVANLSFTMNGRSDRKGIIYGTNGYLVIENINNFESIKAFTPDDRQIAFIKRPKQITGFEYQVKACLEALTLGTIECSQMPHSEIIRMMKMMDSIREEWGIKYPFE